MTLRTLLVLILLSSLVWTGSTVFLLPETCAIHFGWGGAADAWAARGWTVALLMVAVAVLGLLFLGLPVLLRRLPVGFVNLPHRRYWLAPERREAAIARLGGFFTGFGIVHLLFLDAAILALVAAHRHDPVQLAEGPFLLGLGLFGVFVGAWLWRLWRAFRLPSGEASPGPQSRHSTNTADR